MVSLSARLKRLTSTKKRVAVGVLPHLRAPSAIRPALMTPYSFPVATLQPPPGSLHPAAGRPRQVSRREGAAPAEIRGLSAVTRGDTLTQPCALRLPQPERSAATARHCAARGVTWGNSRALQKRVRGVFVAGPLDTTGTGWEQSPGLPRGVRWGPSPTPLHPHHVQRQKMASKRFSSHRVRPSRATRLAKAAEGRLGARPGAAGSPRERPGTAAARLSALLSFFPFVSMPEHWKELSSLKVGI